MQGHTYPTLAGAEQRLFVGSFPFSILCWAYNKHSGQIWWHKEATGGRSEAGGLPTLEVEAIKLEVKGLPRRLILLHCMLEGILSVEARRQGGKT